MHRSISEADAFRLVIISERRARLTEQDAALAREQREIYKRNGIDKLEGRTIVTEPGGEYPVGTIIGLDGQPEAEPSPAQLD
jgi:hypothetical protein